MASDSDDITEVEETQGSNSIIPYRFIHETPCCHFDYVSPALTKIEELETILTKEHKREECSLKELNKKFRHMIDHVRQLESQNAKYMVKVADLRRQAFITNTTCKKSCEVKHMHADVLRVNYDTVRFEAEVEYFEMESQIYQQVGQFEPRSVVKLQQELKESAANLAQIRKQYAVLEQQVANERATCRNTMHQYMTLAKDLTVIRKQTKELKFSMQLVKYQTDFSRTIYSKCDFFALDMSDWEYGWEHIVKKIRHDFRILYAAINQGTIAYYEKKSKEIQAELKQLEECRQTVQGKQIKVLEVVQSDYEEVQRKYLYEQEIVTKLEASYFELESNLSAIQTQQRYQYEAQSQELDFLHASIMEMVVSIEEMQRKKISLENEIIIYRHILGETEIQKKVETTVMRKRTYLEKVHYQGSISIGCSLEGEYIAIINTSPCAVIDISGWMLVRRVDSKEVLRYRLPGELQLKPGTEYRVYSRKGDEEMNEYSYETCSCSHEKLVIGSISSMGVGEHMETQLLDEHGGEVALCIQTAEKDWT